MPETTIRIEKFSGLSELPIHNQAPGKMSLCQNFRVTQDGMLEARGGAEKLLPSGGVATAPISSGIFTGAHEHISPVAWIFRFDGAATYTNNLALQAYFPYFSGTAVGNRIYFISPKKITNIIINIGTAGVGAYTILWKFLEPGGVPQTLVGVTEDFKVAGERTLSFSSPGTIGLNVVNNVYGYVYYAEVATAVIGTMPTQGSAHLGGFFSLFGLSQPIHINWEGMKEIYLASSNSPGGVANGTIQRYGQNSGGTVVWTAVTSSLTSTGDPRIRFASWRGYLYWVNGYEQKRYNLDTVADMGFTAPAGAVTTAVFGVGLTGTFHYAVTYGYGASGELGESNGLQTAATVVCVNQGVTVTLSGLSGVPAAGTVDIMYIYRSVDLGSVAAISTSYGAFPFYRIATITRDANGAFPATAGDFTMKIPQPIATLNPVSNTPPTRCQFITPHRSRMFMAKNHIYPGRVWWSKNFEPESFNQDEDFADLTAGTGGGLTGMIEFADQMIVFTEDTVYGITNVDQDQPYIYVIAKGVGCVAPESLRSGYGLLLWLSRGGVYMWDGNSAPERVSDDLPLTFHSLSVESHGGSRAAIYDRLYELILVSQTDSVATLAYSGPRLRYDLATRTWNTVAFDTMSDVYLGPLMTVTAPLGHQDYGFRHPLYGKIQATGALFHVYVGEFKTQDDGGIILHVARLPLGPPHGQVMTVRRIISVYRVVGGGWGSPPAVEIFGTIGDNPGVVLTGTVYAASGTNYNVAMAQPTGSGMTAYISDAIFTFTALSQAGGTANRQHLIGCYVDATIFPMPMRTN